MSVIRRRSQPVDATQGQLAINNDDGLPNADRARAAPCLSLHAVPMTWPGLLLTCDRERTLEIILRFGRVGGSTAREVALLLFQLGEARLIAARSSHAIIKRIMKPTLVGRGTKEEKPAEE
jgi:hypothetical protein